MAHTIELMGCTLFVLRGDLEYTTEDTDHYVHLRVLTVKEADVTMSAYDICPRGMMP